MEKLQVMIDTAAKPPTGPSDETIKKVKTLYVNGAACLRACRAYSRPAHRPPMQRQEGEPEAAGQ